MIEAEQKQKAQIKVTKNDVVEKIRELKKIMQNPVNIDSTKMVLRQYIDKVEISNNFVEVTFKVAFNFLICGCECEICYNHTEKDYRSNMSDNESECRRTPEKHRNIEKFYTFGSIGNDIVTKRTPNPYRIESSVVEMRRIELLSENLFIPASPSADTSLNSLIKPSSVGLLYLVAPNA